LGGEAYRLSENGTIGSSRTRPAHVLGERSAGLAATRSFRITGSWQAQCRTFGDRVLLRLAFAEGSAELQAPSFPRPSLHLSSQPEPRPSSTEVDDGTRHLRVALLVAAHGIPVAQAQQIGHALGVNQILGSNSRRHGSRLQVLTDAVQRV